MDPTQALLWISQLIATVVKGLIVVIAVLMVIRLIINYADMNPFGRLVMGVRRLTDPFVTPVRRALTGFGIDHKVAPLITILIAILLGWFVVRLADSILGALGGALVSAGLGEYVKVFGYILYGLLDVYGLLIVIRIIFSWGTVSYVNPVMRFLVNVTDPLLVPLRRMIPPLGMFDLSPIVALLIIWMFKAAVAGTLLR